MRGDNILATDDNTLKVILKRSSVSAHSEMLGALTSLDLVTIQQLSHT